MPINIPFPSGGYPAQVVGGGARKASAAFDAISDAVRFYTQLKQQQQEHELRVADQQRQQASVEAQSQYYRDLVAGQQRDDERQADVADTNKFYKMADAYGGQEAPPDAVALARKRGLMAGLVPQQTLPSRQTGQGVGMIGDDTTTPTPMTTTQAPAVANGNYTFRDTETSALRAALARAQASADNNAASNASREKVAGMNNATRLIAAREAVQSAARNTDVRVMMQKYGYDINNATSLEAIAAAMQRHGQDLDERGYNDFITMTKTPFGMMQFINQMGAGGGGMPTPPYYKPPTPSAPSAPGAPPRAPATAPLKPGGTVSPVR